jgi:multiple sugar transport system permease protein
MSAPATVAAPAAGAPAPARTARRRRPKRARSPWLHVAMIPITLLWLSPIVFVLFVAIRSYDDIAGRGLGAFPASFSTDGFATALVPVAAITEAIGIADTRTALVVVQVGFGIGFYTFVLHGFMRGLPNEVFEKARLDGAGPGGIFWRIVLPLSRPSLAALAALATTWIFNDLIWAMTVLRTESKFPITAALLNLQGGYASAWNVVAAGSLIAAVPTAIVFFMFQKQFVSGLLVGANK